MTAPIDYSTIPTSGAYILQDKDISYTPRHYSIIWSCNYVCLYISQDVDSSYAAIFWQKNMTPAHLQKDALPSFRITINQDSELLQTCPGPRNVQSITVPSVHFSIHIL